ncbi:hypothetical protein [Lysobacter sp. Root667]|uniref:hypothetical protein n=1 Tax=Lysobacter sp. Root667 TaxID=1736581 RepID=UPI0006F61C43|nr:hypothetical protein [Lysobacter sp. Root667]
MNRYGTKRWLGLMAAAGLGALTGCASVGREAAVGTPMEDRPIVGAGFVGQPAGWPDAVPLPEGAEIDGHRCANRYCTLWFGLMTLDEAMVLKRRYIKMLKDSGKWEQLGSPGDPYEPEAFRYTGAVESGCGYTLEIKQGSVPNDYYHRWRVTTSMTW